MYLRILGKFPLELLEKYKEVLNCYSMKSSEVILFCDYSEYDIPIGHIFNNIEDVQNKRLFSGAIMLKTVSQEFALQFDLIPKGYKTICKFEFLESNIPEAINNLPVLYGWHESNTTLILK